MSAKCEQLHSWFNGMRRYRYPFNGDIIPPNGIYVQFENGEAAHSGDRIVRIGTHDGQGNLRQRLEEHYEDEGRSVFRRKIRCALINQNINKGFGNWTQDDLIDAGKAKLGEAKKRLWSKGKWEEIDSQLSNYIRRNISFVFIEVEDLKSRKIFEAKLISTISNCKDCQKSEHWLGNFSTKPKVYKSGLWQEQELWKADFTDTGFEQFEGIINASMKKYG